MSRKIVENIIVQLRDIQNGKTWYDDNLENKIEPISETQAFERPIPEVHSAAELIYHIWVWRMHAIKLLRGQESKLGIESPENWKRNEALKKMGWKKLKANLRESQAELIAFLSDKNDDYLENNTYKPNHTLKYLVEGIIHHDLYHLGQIGITIKLLDMDR
ncbi:DinB family protein [Flagellimonas taeanensis]|uniref:DinB family protein n=1 Tax=Flavobacteriaceae TaxID=49546 RepID=UPI000E6806C2|nr:MULTISPECIES: DinB family protein [Allomuricauda]MDC6385712.1 DinB family protein [Muricauda sp. SK9]RIV50998.1 DinB family protein [Allomuricauda taeanensis]